MILPAIWIAVCAAAPTVESVLKRMASLSIPDTADYRAVTTVRSAAVATTVSMHVIQAGRNLRRMELDAGGRRNVLVTNGSRSSSTDLATGKSVALPSLPQAEDPVEAMKRFMGSRWDTPVPRGGDQWEMRQIVDGDSTTLSRSLIWDDAAGEVRSLEQIGRSRDTTHIGFKWIRVDGRTVPSSITVAHSAGMGAIHAETVFSGWMFPRSIPSSLFTIR